MERKGVRGTPRLTGAIDSKMQQLPLDVRLADYALFETFFTGPNDACVHALRDVARVATRSFTWIWGPPEDQLQLLLGTIGADRFVFGTGQPLRLPEASIAKMDLLDVSESDRAMLLSGNATRLDPAL